MKRPFLAVHDYGMGGVWAYIWASSREEAESRFAVTIVDELPAWLKGDSHLVASLDVDDPPPDWLPLR
jgi:hypothetical protein